MTVTHDDDISITIRLDPPPEAQVGFGTVLHLAPKTDASLGGERVKTYKSLEEVKNDEGSGLSSSQVDAATFAFSQNNTPDELMVGNVDLGGSEDHATALQKVIDKDPSFYGVTAESRTDTETAKLASAVEAHQKPMLCAIQSSLTDIKSGVSDPTLDGTDLSNLVGNERTILNYHDRDGAYSALALLVDRLGFDPDRTSAPWHTHLSDAGASQAPIHYSTALIGSEKDNIEENNANAVAPFGSSDHYLKPGQTMAGRMAYVQLTADWFKARLESDTANEIQDASRDGNKIPVGEVGETRSAGQVQMAKLVKKWFSRGADPDVGHFYPGSWEVGYPEILQSNVDNGTVPLSGNATLVADGQDATFTFEFERG